MTTILDYVFGVLVIGGFSVFLGWVVYSALGGDE